MNPWEEYQRRKAQGQKQNGKTGTSSETPTTGGQGSSVVLSTGGQSRPPLRGAKMEENPWEAYKRRKAEERQKGNKTPTDSGDSSGVPTGTTPLNPPFKGGQGAVSVYGAARSRLEQDAAAYDKALTRYLQANGDSALIGRTAAVVTPERMQWEDDGQNDPRQSRLLLPEQAALEQERTQKRENDALSKAYTAQEAYNSAAEEYTAAMDDFGGYEPLQWHTGRIDDAISKGDWAQAQSYLSELTRARLSAEDRTRAAEYIDKVTSYEHLSVQRDGTAQGAVAEILTMGDRGQWEQLYALMHSEKGAEYKRLLMEEYGIDADSEEAKKNNYFGLYSMLQYGSLHEFDTLSESGAYFKTQLANNTFMQKAEGELERAKKSTVDEEQMRSYVQAQTAYYALEALAGFLGVNEAGIPYRDGKKEQFLIDLLKENGVNLSGMTEENHRAVIRQALQVQGEKAGMLSATLQERGYDTDTVYEYLKLSVDSKFEEFRQSEFQKWSAKTGMGEKILTDFLMIPYRTAVEPFTSAVDMLSLTGSGSDTDDPNSYVPVHLAQSAADMVRSAATEAIEKNTNWELFGRNVASFLYSAGMSAADSAANAFAYGHFATLAMGTRAAGAEAADIIERGGSRDQAFFGGLAAGVIEAATEYFSVEKLLQGAGSVDSLRAILKNVGSQAFTEGTEEMASEVLNIIVDSANMGNLSRNSQAIQAYMAEGMSYEEASKQVIYDNIGQVVEAGVQGALSGAMSGGTKAVASYASRRTELRKLGDLLKANTLDMEDMRCFVDTGLESAPDTRSYQLAVKLEKKLDKGYRLSKAELAELYQANGEAIRQEELAEKEARLEEQRKTWQEELAARQNMQNAEEVVSDRETATEHIGAAEYSKLVSDANDALDHAEEAPVTEQSEGDKTEIPVVAPVAPVANRTEGDDMSSSSTVDSSVQAESTVSIEAASEKYGRQAKAMVATYNQGQDVAKFDRAFGLVYEMGKSGVNFSYVSKNGGSYLTEEQKQLAYEIGEAAAADTANATDDENKTAANGKTGRKQGGVVRGEGVKIADLKKAFNDPRGKAYRALSTIAKVTGVNIVLFKSQTDAEGNFIGEQGKYDRTKPGEIWIDVNAGLENISDVGDLEKYVLLRTFSHEFTHFIEKWNPVRYNEFRRIVFDTLTERGVDADSLIEAKMDETGLDYEPASREAIADAMTDILQDSQFVQTLAQKHKTVFAKILEKLKEFVQNIKDYFDSLGPNDAMEANALKEHGKYLDSIVKLWDEIAVEAVETYQQTVATEEVVVSKKENTTGKTATKGNTTVSKAESVANNATVDNGQSFTITENAEHGSLEIAFDSKPSEEVRQVLKEHKFRWHKVKKLWFGYADRQTITDALRATYQADQTEDSEPVQEQSAFEKAFRNAGQAERDEVVDAIRENTNITHVAPTEIRESTPVGEKKEEVVHGEESEDGSDAGAVHESVRGSEETSRLLEGVEPETVRGGNEGREPVQVGGEQGTADAGRDRRADASGDVSARSTGNRVGGDLQQLSAVEEPAIDDPVGDNLAQSDEEAEPSDTEAEVLREMVIDLTAQKSTENPKGGNFVIGDSLNLPNGTKARIRANIEAIKLVKRIAAENRIATPAEQEILSKYVGWGGLADAFGEPVTNYATRKIEYEAASGLEAEFEELKSVLSEEEYRSARESTKNAHYTSIEVIRAMYDGLKHLGFAGGRMLEPSAGVGNFVGAMPSEMTAQVKSWTMVELDSITGLFAKYLYPNADVRIQGFENTNIPDGYMDVAIGNVPFGNDAISDKHYPKAVTGSIHNYFFAKSLDKVRPGGVVMFITSRYTMDKRDSAVRKYIMQRADLLGAIRLPNTAFAGNAGTSVVTDILILKKRADRTEYTGESFEDITWQNYTGGGASVNGYFANHPEMVLGNIALGRGMYGSSEMTVNPFADKGSLGNQIRNAMKNIRGKMDYPAQLSPEKGNFRQEAAKKKSRKLQVKDGVIHSVDENGTLIKVDADKETADRIAGMIAIRDAHTALCDALQQGVKKTEITKLRKALNKAYDSFVEKYGYLNAPKNKKAVNTFTDRYAIQSLENYSAEGKKLNVTKADIFSKDTISANRTQASAENVEEGLTVSLNTAGIVDVDLIAKLTGQKVPSVTRQLIDQRLVFKDKNGNLIPAAQYLSGNVRAKLREMEGLVGIDSDYRNNVEALREVVPPTVQYTDIHVNPGANWVPVSMYEEFVGHILNRQNSTAWRTGKKDFSVEYVPETNEYKVSINDSFAKMSAQNTQVWGESGKAFSVIFENMLNGRRTNVYKDAGDGTRVLDREKTEAVAEKVEKLNEEFRKWLWGEESRRAEMQELYNEVYNALVTPKYSGASLTVNGLNSEYSLRAHQKDAVARIINSGGNTLLAHRVGAGKTMEMATAAMKLKQLGIIKKPMFVVPNNVVAQWGEEFKAYFPAANILLVGDEDMTPAERMTTINKIKNNDYDAVILAYTKFEKIPMTTAWRQRFYEEQIDNLLFAINAEKESKGEKGFTVKQLETKRKQLEAKIKKLTDKAKDEDGAMFEDLGVDSLFVDEAHNFKNLEYSTRMNNVSGLGNADGSQRAFDLYTKVRYLQQLNGGRGVVFATATPVMNSMTEMYIMQKYLQPDTLRQLGIEHFDSWAKMFGEVVNALEIAPSGSGYRLKQTFSKFKNIKALQQLFRSFTDVLTDIPGLKIPKMKGKKVQIVECEQGEFQKNYMAELAKRAENVRNVDPSVDNMLKITSDGRKISYSQRMIDPGLPYEESGKIYKCCENVYAVYQESNATKGTQMIFCDMATPKGKSSVKGDSEVTADEFSAVDTESAQLYDDMKARLVQLGIPAKEIAFIHDAKNDKQKAALSEKMNNGTIRVLIGSTGKMGVGLNAQKKAVAIHHLDAPWRPGDIEQRDGRVFRQKNENEEAYKFVYVTRGSFDSRLWDILERKQKFINQVMNGEDVGNEIEDTGEVTLSATEVKAVASDNPLIMEQVALEKEISKLQSLQQAHTANVSRAQERLITDRRNIANLETLISNVRADIQNRVDTYSAEKVFSVRIDGQTHTDKRDAGLALVATAQAKATTDGYTDIGFFAGFTLRVVKTAEGIKGQLSGAGNYELKTYPLNPTMGITHLCGVVQSFEDKLAVWNKRLSETKNDLQIQREIVSSPFEQAQKLKEKRERYREVMDALNPPKEEQSLDSDGGDVVQYQHRKNRNSYKNISQQEYRQIQEDRMTKYGGDFENMPSVDYTYAHDLLYVFENFDETRFGVLERIDPAKNKVKAGFVEEAFRNGQIQDKQDLDGRIARLRNFQKLRSVYRSDVRNGRTGTSNAGLDFGVGKNPDGGRVLGTSNEDQEQYQRRTNTLSNREVLALAAEELRKGDLTAAERDALDIFLRRLAKLEELQEKRAEQGRLYREQQFGAKVDRVAAEKTRNRMQILDGQIERAKAEVLSIEDKQVLRQVLQKARKIVEKQQWAHDQEVLKRYRERRNEAEVVKKYRERLTKDVKNLTDWVLHPNNKDVMKHIPDVLKQSVIPFLASIDFTSKRALNGGAATKVDRVFTDRLEGLKEALNPNQNAEILYSGYSDLPPNFMERLDKLIKGAKAIAEEYTGDFVVNRMNAQELRELSQVVRTLKQYIQNFNRFHANAMFQHVSDAGDNTISELQGMKNAGDRVGDISNSILWRQIRPSYAFERFGEGGMAVYDGLRRGQAKLAFLTKEIQAFAEKAYTAEEVKAWEKEIKSVRLGDDIVRIPVSFIMSLYELSKRQQALGHILGQGLRVATYKVNGRKISDSGHTLTPEDVQTMIDMLTDRQKAVADSLQQFMQEQGGKWGNEVSVKRFGEELFGEENYFPINSDGRHLEVNADEHPSAASLYALLNMGFTKSTTEGANNRLVLYSIFDVFANHMASMAQYSAFALPVVDAIKWLNYQQKSEANEEGKRIVLASVRDQMDRVYGVPEEGRPGSGRQGYAQSFVINILRAFNGTETQGIPTDAPGLNALRRYNMAQVAYNFRVVVQQPLAITRAGLLVDYSSIIRGMKLSPAAIRKNIEEMQKYSGIAAWKSLGFYDVNISRGLTDIIKHRSNVMDQIREAGMWGAEKADTLTWAGIWSACKEEVIRKQNLTPKSEGFYEAVTQLFEDVIYKTQVVDSVLTKSEYMRSKGFWARNLSSFMSEPTTSASMLIGAYDKYHADLLKGMSRQQAWKKNRRMIGRTTYVYALGAVMLAAVQAISDAFRDDDDYQEWYEKWLEAFGGNFVDEIMPLNKLPTLKPVYEAAKSILSAGGFDIYAQISQVPYVELVEKLKQGIAIFADKINGEDTNYTWYAGIYKLLQFASGMTGLPMAAATREIVTAWNSIVGPMAPSLKVKTYDSGEKNEIKYAYLDGYLSAEEAKEHLLQRELVDDEDEAYWLLRSWDSGGESKYSAVFDAALKGESIEEAMQELTDHGHKEEAVLSQLKSQIQTWYNDEESEVRISKQEATDMLRKYFDMKPKEVTATINRWTCKVVTGIAYDDIKGEFLKGNITTSRAIEMRMLYGGESRDVARNKIAEWDFEKKYGFAYSDRKDAYINGEATAAELRRAMTTFGKMSSEEANDYIRACDWLKRNPQYEFSVNDAITYTRPIKAIEQSLAQVGIKPDVFMRYKDLRSKCEGVDEDGDGKADKDTVKAEILDVIDSLPISASQKDALYYLNDWAESTILEVPW